MNSSFSIQSAPIDLHALRAQLDDPNCGALVLFEGLVRNHHLGKSVKTLSYEHHPIMAVPEGENVIREALKKFPITQARAIHRIGTLQISELAVVTAVTSPHRAASFEACEYLIDELKHRVPIWKYEEYEDGSHVYTEQCEGCSKKAARSA